ncbi:MAG: VOC family protein [Chloroflexota bacterium]|nr:VOC family protein [Chloroflexota bacterium]
MSSDNGKVELKQFLQVCVVVKDLQKAMENYWELFGMGPWAIYTFAPPTLTDTTVRGESVPYTMKLAVTQIGNVQWELIEPLTGPSTYAEFLEEHGPGLHHVAVHVDDYDKTVSTLEKHGIGVLMGGNFHGLNYAYMDTHGAIGAILEIYKGEMENMPPPEAVWPTP